MLIIVEIVDIVETIVDTITEIHGDSNFVIQLK